MLNRRMRGLDTLLRVRRDSEEARAREMALAQTAVNEARRRRAGIRASQQAALHGAARLLESPAIDASDARTYYQYERHLARSLDECDADIRALEDELERKRHAVSEAAAERKMIEKLRERRLQEWSHHVRKMEQRAADETAQVRAQLQRDAGGREDDRSRTR